MHCRDEALLLFTALKDKDVFHQTHQRQ